MKIDVQTKTTVPEYADFLKRARISSRLRLEDVAKEVGVSSMSISYWEQGKREPTISKFEKWLDVFGIKLVMNLKSKGRDNGSV